MATTLADVEREVAARAGPFEQHAAASGTTTTAVVAALRSSIPLGGYTDRWLLRRGAPVPEDRQRRIVAYDPATGTLTVDRPYTVPVAVAEALEVGVLDPAQELRPAVLRGLARCFFVERAAVEVVPGAAAQNLAAALFWLTDLGQVRDVQWRTDPAAGAVPLTWYRLLSSSDPTGGLAVGLEPSAAPAGAYVVEALRPHATWVNGRDAPTGPAADADALACPLDYAAALGHAEAWRRCRATLAPIARAGYAEGIESVQREVTRLVRGQWWYWDRPDRVRVPNPAAGLAAAGSGATPTPVAGQTWHQVSDGYSWRGLSAQTWRQVLEGAA